MSGRTAQLLIKTSRESDATIIIDTAPVVSATNPLILGAQVDTLTAGFARATDFPGELWITDPVYGLQLVNEFILSLSNPIKQTFL
jgi:hypothetical protein